MVRYKAITILTLLSVAANTAVASWRPCCCVEHEQKRTRDCCAEAEAEPRVERVSCCATSEPGSEYIHPALNERPCCCVKSLPAVPNSRAASIARDTAQPVKVIVSDHRGFSDGSPIKHRLTLGQPGLLVPDAPSICALYCIWLK